MKTAQPAGVILAGGRSRRMGVRHKALLDLNGQPLLAHVINRIQAHLGLLMLNCERESSEFESFGLQIVPDLLPGFRGPLTGLYSALQYLLDHENNSGLVLCPCDAPFVPVNLVQNLLDAGQEDDRVAVVISYQGVLQPTFSYWRSGHLAVVHDAVINKGLGGLKQVLPLLPHRIVEWPPAEPSPFFNVNTPADLNAAAVWLDHPSASTHDG